MCMKPPFSPLQNSQRRACGGFSREIPPESLSSWALPSWNLHRFETLSLRFGSISNSIGGTGRNRTMQKWRGRRIAFHKPSSLPLSPWWSSLRRWCRFSRRLVRLPVNFHAAEPRASGVPWMEPELNFPKVVLGRRSASGFPANCGGWVSTVWILAFSFWDTWRLRKNPNDLCVSSSRGWCFGLLRTLAEPKKKEKEKK